MFRRRLLNSFLRQARSDTRDFSICAERRLLASSRISSPARALFPAPSLLVNTRNLLPWTATPKHRTHSTTSSPPEMESAPTSPSFAPVHEHESRVCNDAGSWHNPTGALLRQLHENVWVVERGYISRGLDAGGKTTIIRLPDNRLFVHSPLPLTAELKADVDAAGVVSAVVAPNANHLSFIGSWARHYPNAAMLSPPTLRASMPNVPFTDELDEHGSHPSFTDEAGSIRAFYVASFEYMRETMFYHVPSSTLLCTDIIMNFPRNVPFGTKVFDFITAKIFKPLVFRTTTKDALKFHETLDEIEALGFTTLVPCHGEVATENALEVFQTARARSYGNRKGA